MTIKLNDADWNDFQRRCRESGLFPAEMGRWALQIFAMGLSGHSFLVQLSDKDWYGLKQVAKKMGTDDLNALIITAVQSFIELKRERSR